MFISFHILRDCSFWYVLKRWENCCFIFYVTDCPNAFTLMDFSYVPNSNIGLTCVTLASYFEGKPFPHDSTFLKYSNIFANKLRLDTCPTYNNGGKVTVTCSAYLSNLTGSDDACLLKGALDGLYDMPNLSQACCTLPFNYSST